MTKRRLWTLATLALVVGVVAGSLFALRWVHRFQDRASDAYALIDAGRLLGHYVQDHPGQWPTSWKDLRAVHEARLNGADDKGWFQQIQRRVVIDWTVDLETLRAAAGPEEPPFPVLRLVHIRSDEPATLVLDANRQVHDALKQAQETDADPGG